MRQLLLILLLAATALAGCAQESSDPAGDETDTQPPAADTETVMPSAFGETLSHAMDGSGQGIWVRDGILYWTNGADLHLVDVSDPASPQDLGSVEDIGARDVDLVDWQDRTYAVLAGSSRGMHLVDVTDPAAPEHVTTVNLPSAGVHNLASVPGTPYVYSSGASGTTASIDVADFTTPHDPVVHTFAIPTEMGGVAVTSDGCHDITVRVDLERAYCAGGGGMYAQGGGETFIWDISEDPTDPRWISMMDDPRIVYHHQAMVNESGDLLVINDEFIAPNCVHLDTPLPGALDPQVPTAAAWVYDISDEQNPRQLSLVQNPAIVEDMAVPTNCGSHFGDMVPGHDAFAMGWYQGGTLLVSLEDPENPEILDRLGAEGSTWDARVMDGHVFHGSGDLLVTLLE